MTLSGRPVKYYATALVELGDTEGSERLRTLKTMYPVLYL